MCFGQCVLQSARFVGLDTVGLSKMCYILLSIKLSGQGSKALLKPVSNAHNPLSITSAWLAYKDFPDVSDYIYSEKPERWSKYCFWIA